MKKITVKLALFFITLICIATMLSFFVAAFFTGNIGGEIRNHQRTIANSLIELDKKTDLNTTEIMELMSSSIYYIYRIREPEELGISEAELRAIKNHQYVFFPRTKYRVNTTVLRLNNDYIGISLHPHNNTFKIVISRIWISMLSTVIFGSLLISGLVKKAVKPVLEVTKATQEVAKGNFDIQVENKSQDEVGQLAQNFNKMTRELRNIEYLRKDFITNVSHEFKTPIASIQGFAKLLQKNSLTEEERLEYTSIIVEETARLTKLSSNILKLSKLESQEILGKNALFSLDEQIRKSILLLENQWSKKGIDFEVDLDRVNFSGDEELLQQVWINLLDNAIKFSENNGVIKVRLKMTSNIIKVIIIDNGIGMSDETISRIFEKFYQGDKAHSHEGSGLGMSLVKRILDLYNGTISIDSKLNEGSTFTIELHQ